MVSRVMKDLQLGSYIEAHGSTIVLHDRSYCRMTARRSPDGGSQ
jgi:hypothetical protein